MANRYQIERTFQQLGSLYGAEHAEGDDVGAEQIQGLVKGLRKFAAHEQSPDHPGGPAIAPEASMMREATYQLHDGRHVYYDDGHETLRDAADLYRVLNEQHKTGSPNIENQRARTILARLQSGAGLGEMHIGTLRGLLAKHGPAIAKARASGNADGQDLLAMASAGPDSRITPATSQEA